ncbi:unnamed protein product, partial [Polarella glacialis]
VLPWSLSSVVFTTEGHVFPLPQERNFILDQSAGRTQQLYPTSALSRPLATCEALTPFERVSVQQRCREKYLLTQSYQIQMMGSMTRKCRPQDVLVLVWSQAKSTALALPEMRISGLASSLGQQVAALPLLYSRQRTRGGSQVTTASSSCAAAGGGCGSGNGSTLEAQLLSEGLSVKTRQDDLALLRLDLDNLPGLMPHFTA